MHVLHVFNVIKATNTLSEKNLGCRFVEQVVTQKRTFFWRVLFKALIHLEHDICLLLDAQSTSHSYSISHFTEIFGKLSQAIATEKWRIHLPRAGFINWGHCALTTMKTVLNDPDWSTGSGRVLTTCKFNDSLGDSCSCFVRCEIFLFNWPVRMQTRKCASIFFHLIVSSTRFRHMCQQSPRVPYHQITKKLYEGELAQQKHQLLVFYHPHKPPGQRVHWKQSFSKTLPMRINLKTPPRRFRLDGRKKKIFT